MSVSVLTGGCTREELLEAGTHVVLDSLEEFPGWLDDHLLDLRLAALEARLRELGSVRRRLQRRRRQRAPARRRGAGARPRPGRRGHRLLRLPARRWSATPGASSSPSLGVRLLTPRTHEMEREGYRANSGERCYFCKAELIETLRPLADEHGIAHVATGTNADDAVAGFRPGIRAAAERGAVTPLLDAGLTKDDVRRASRRWGLPTWDKPAAACLSSRVAYGIEVTPHRLARVERAEAAVRADAGRRGPGQRRTCGCATWGSGAASSSTATWSPDRWPRARPRRPTVLAAVRSRRLRRGRDRPARLPLRVPQRGAGRGIAASGIAVSVGGFSRGHT